MIVHAVEVNGVSLKFQLCLFASGDCLLPDVVDVFFRVAADEYFFTVAEVAGFCYELENFRVRKGSEFFVVFFAHFGAYSF